MSFKLLRTKPLRSKFLAGVALALVAGCAVVASVSGPAASKTQDRLPQATSSAPVRFAALAMEGQMPRPDVLPGLPPDLPWDLLPSGPGDEAGARPPRPPHPRDAAGPLGLAQTLAAAETAIGVRPNQMEAWRDFTDALQAALPSP
ncbi:hypothetical protein K9U41_17000, partial [Xanthobacter autotrophicus]|nr:hypothetical protein [Xanthobacter autotrophicus]